MSSRAALVLLASAVAFAQSWQAAVSGYRYNFPRDHFSHPNYQTEWWYYTGNLRGADGHRYGFELTFFREGVRLPAEAAAMESAAWRPDHIYLAHLAFSDLDGGEFYHTERLNRAGPGLAGATEGSTDQKQRYWNGNWSVDWKPPGTGEQTLHAVSEKLKLELTLRPEKPWVIHGADGISHKGPLPGEASHYISFTRLQATGQVDWKGAPRRVEGVAWMDHEFFSEPRDESLAGWDWFAIQLDSHEELMLYRLRTKSGSVSAYSSGTWVDAEGGAHFLRAEEFVLSPLGTWRSDASGATYPIEWNISVPSLALELKEETSLKKQELVGSNGITPIYWEGAVSYHGTEKGQAVKGVGYLEMTGYAGAVDLAGK